MGNTGSLNPEDITVEHSKEQVYEDWRMSPGKLNGSPIMAFCASHPRSSRKRPFMEKALQWSKVLRHPNLLRFISGELSNDVIIITEEATPLLQSNVEQLDTLQITSGIVSMIEAVAFLHDKAGVSHNNLCTSSIFVTPDGTWKLWGLEYVCPFGELTKDHLTRINPYVNQKSIPPDDLRSISPSYQHARDSYALGILIKEFAHLLSRSGMPFVAELVKVVETECLGADWSKRIRFVQLSRHQFFTHDFIQIKTSLSNILLLSATERDTLIKDLPKRLKQYPEGLVASTLSTLLLNHTLLLVPGSAEHLMPFVLKPKVDEASEGIFSESCYRTYILKPLVNLFTLHDCTVRKILLKYFEHYAGLLDEDCLLDIILPELLLGLKDKNELLVSMTMKALAHLIPILGADAVIGRNREHIFTEAKPRTLDALKLTEMRGKQLRRQQGLVVQSSIQAFDKQQEQSDPSSEDSTMFCDGRGPNFPRERSAPDGGEEITPNAANTNGDASASSLLYSSKDFKDLGRGAPSKHSVLDGDRIHRDSHSELADKRYGANEADSWSDWEEMLDQPMPEIKGVLEVKSPERDLHQCELFTETRSLENYDGAANLKFHENLNGDRPENRRTGSLRSSFRKKSFSLGEEYDIMALEVNKKRDAELDLFASIAPDLTGKSFDLEKMLLDASERSNRSKKSSFSDALAKLELGGREDDAWENDDDIFGLENSLSS